MRVGAVLMASGSGARFGSNKLLYLIEGAPMFEHAFAAVPPHLFAQSCVVSCYPEILEQAKRSGFQAIFNPHADEGQSASVRLGLSALLEMDGALFCVCDQPWLSKKSVEHLLAEFMAYPDCICALSWQGVRGSPVIFPRDLFPALQALTGDRGGSGIIRANRDRLRLVETSTPMELQDVDVKPDKASESNE